VTIDALDDRGDGVAQADGTPVTVPFTIPGERVRVALPAATGQGRAMRAALTEVLWPSPHRARPACAHFGPQTSGGGPCGGCAWQHITYTEQLRIKTAIVGEVVRTAVPRAPRVRPMLSATPDHPWGFRRKVHFVFGAAGRDGRLVMGHLARASRRVIEVRECPVHAEAGNRIAFTMRAAYRRAGVRAWTPGNPRRDALRGVAVRVSSDESETLTTLVVAHDHDRRLRDATRRLIAEQATGRGLHLNEHGRDDGFIFGSNTRRLSGVDRVRETVAGVSFLISPTAFFQTNVAAAEVLVRLVLDAVPPDLPVLDLYAGAGLFTLPLARRGQRVTAIEENGEAVRDGIASQALNRIPKERCHWIARPVEAGLARVRATGAVVLDPPREGCANAVLRSVFSDRGPVLAVYVSCNPGTLGRDLLAITRHGYAVTSVQPVDMFPHTPHIETVVTLKRDDRAKG
jgi:23S rRNA (uracil1939-C5)-methyltransferase